MNPMAKKSPPPAKSEDQRTKEAVTGRDRELVARHLSQAQLPSTASAYSESDATDALEAYGISDQDAQLCAACGHWGLRHSADGCHTGKNGQPFRDTGYPPRSRDDLRKSGDLCWCPSFVSDPLEAREIILNWGPARALEGLILDACKRKDVTSIERNFNAYVSRVPKDQRDADVTSIVQNQFAGVQMTGPKKQRKLRPSDPLKVAIANIKAGNPGMKASEICNTMDRQSKPALMTWYKKSKERTWIGNYRNRATRNLVEAYISKIPAAAS